MNREQIYEIMSGEGTLDYELYLNTKTLLSCQTKFDELCNADDSNWCTRLKNCG